MGGSSTSRTGSLPALALLAALIGCWDSSPPATPGGEAEGGGVWLGLVVEEGPLPAGQVEGHGLYVRTVVAGGPAAQAGVQSGDILFRIETHPIPTLHDLKHWLDEIGPGRSLFVSLLRPAGDAYETRTVVLVLGEDDLAARVDRALLAGTGALARLRNPGAGWPAFQGEPPRPSSPAVTGLSLVALAGLGPDMAERYREDVAEAARYLAEAPDEAGSVAEGSEQVIKLRSYATALALSAFSRLGIEEERRQQLRAYLLETQLDEAEGIPPYDWHHGSWNYYPGLSRRTFRSDMSVHTFCLNALVDDGVRDEGVLGPARGFVLRSQATGSTGFAFSPRNSKAGMLVADDGSLVLLAYGSATADALRCLLLTGARRGDPAVEGALSWLAEHWRTDVNPGFPQGEPTGWEHGVHLYFLYAAATALGMLGSGTFPSDGGIRWAEEIARRLVTLQGEDGTFRNESALMHEDDPVIGTALSLLALEACRPYLAAGR